MTIAQITAVIIFITMFVLIVMEQDIFQAERRFRYQFLPVLMTDRASACQGPGSLVPTAVREAICW